MSIITDALKKAERDRELKAKQGLQDTAFAGANGDNSTATLLAQSDAVEQHIEKSKFEEGIDQAIFRRPDWYQSSQLQVIFLFIAAGLACALVLFALPEWPRIGENFSIVWQPFNSKSKNHSYTSGLGVFGKGIRTSVSASQFTLSGITSTGNDHFAIVNGTIVQKGGSIDGAYVKDISNQEVILETKNGEIILKIPSSF